ncbi:MAG: sulfur oxidation c-type cytochrome SoxA [Xanthomonadales bacterium]|nr:sulfur oxidation c-type cytochrome SoxA [Xanthomonadales bacterium]
MIGLRSITLAVLLGTTAVHAGPEEDRQRFREFYQNRLSSIPLEAHVDGAYAMNAGAREQWLEMEEFPPYEFELDEGQELFEASFADGESLASCFPEGGQGVRQGYPYFDEEAGEVVTLELAINRCREAHGEQPLPYLSGDLAKISAYMAYTSRGNVINVPTPQSEAALAAYESGKQFYYSRRGQLNFACSSCHMQNTGLNLRAEILSASLGHTSHWPVYRLKWEELGTLHKRFQECNSQVGAVPLEAQSEAYRNLEYFLTYMSNGLEINGPGTRK